MTETRIGPNVDGLSSGLVAAGQRPGFPMPPVSGGEVKAAHMISSVSPAYPQLARNQHISGDVRINALIDAEGRVSGMEVVSGPVLLREAATSALRQWKYQPATLDGKPVPMHVMVTIQFRME